MLFRPGDFLNIFLCLALIISSTGGVLAQTIIHKAYFNSDNSFILEVDGPIRLEEISKDFRGGGFVHKYQLIDTKIKAGINRGFKKSNPNKNVTAILKNKKILPKLTKAKQDTELTISSLNKDLNLKLKDVLKNSAYEVQISFMPENRHDFQEGIKLNPISIEPLESLQSTYNSTKQESSKGLQKNLEMLPTIKEQTKTAPIHNHWKTAQQVIKKDSLHQLFVHKNENGLLHPSNNLNTKEKETKIHYNKAISQIKETQILAALKSNDYQLNKERLEESSDLSLLADTLIDFGQKEKALKAYQKSIELNPQNLEVKLKLAKHSTSKSEQLNNYLETISTEALTSIGSAWLEHSLENNDPDSLAAALVSFQYAVLKNPLDPNLRYQYARALEKSGTKNTSKSAQRYLEAAALSKQRFLHGDNSVLQVMRDSIESLIKLTIYNGDFKKALAYCDSYSKLGFKNFLKGESISYIQKNLAKNKNPFLKKELSKYNSKIQKYKVKLLEPNFIDYPSLGEGVSFEIIDIPKHIANNKAAKRIIKGKVLKFTRDKVFVQSNDTLWQFNTNNRDANNNLMSSAFNGALIGALAVGIGTGISTYGIANGAGAAIGAIDGMLKEYEKDISLNLAQNDLIIVNKRRKTQ